MLWTVWSVRTLFSLQVTQNSYWSGFRKKNTTYISCHRKGQWFRHRWRQGLKYLCVCVCVCLLYNCIFIFIFFPFILIYNTVLVLPYIDMNPPRVYMRSQTWTPTHLPPHNVSLGHHRAPAPSMLYPASDIDWRFDSYVIALSFLHSPTLIHTWPLEKP